MNHQFGKEETVHHSCLEFKLPKNLFRFDPHPERPSEGRLFICDKVFDHPKTQLINGMASEDDSRISYWTNSEGRPIIQFMTMVNNWEFSIFNSQLELDIPASFLQVGENYNNDQAPTLIQGAAAFALFWCFFLKDKVHSWDMPNFATSYLNEDIPSSLDGSSEITEWIMTKCFGRHPTLEVRGDFETGFYKEFRTVIELHERLIGISIYSDDNDFMYTSLFIDSWDNGVASYR